MTKRLRLLVVEDSENDAILTLRELRRGGYEVESERVQDAEAMAKALTGRTWDLVISDWSMPRFSALGALAVLKESGLDLPFLVVSGTIGEETAITALHAGAHDFVLKGRLTRLLPAIERELRDGRARAAHRQAEEDLRASELALRKADEQLRQAQKMEAVGRLAGGVAHDFNNALSVILSYCELLMGDLDPANSMRADLEEIRKAGRRAADLTRQLLTFSRQQVVEPHSLDLNVVLSDLDKMLRRIVGEDVDLVTHHSPSPARVIADQGQIEQVVMNLVVNARDAMPTGGRLTIETANVELDEDYVRDHLGARPGPHVMLAVTDTGCGMDRATQARIFEPFFTTKELGKGTGLGLSTVFGIVQQTGGSIWVYSEQGQGTSFKVYLPRTDAEALQSRPPPEPATLRGSETVLLVEDEEQLRIVAADVLRRNGYEVIESRNAAEALLAVEHHRGRIDLLLTDVVMPGMSGAELAARLKESWPGLRVLCMSGYTDDTVVRHGILGSGMAFLQKPITPDSLLRKIRETLGRDPRGAG